MAVSDWLQELFSDGFSGMSDEQIILKIYNHIISDEFSYARDIGDEWQSIAEFLDARIGDCEDFSHLFFSGIS